MIEAPRLDSAAGTAVTLLNWSDEPLNHVEVTIRNPGSVTSVSSAERGPLHFTRIGNDVRVTVELSDEAKKKHSAAVAVLSGKDPDNE